MSQFIYALLAAALLEAVPFGHAPAISFVTTTSRRSPKGAACEVTDQGPSCLPREHPVELAGRVCA